MSSKTQVDPYGLFSFFSPWPRPHRPRPTTRAHSHWLRPAHTGPSHTPHSQRPRPHGHPTASPAEATRPLAPSISALCVPLSANLFPRASAWHVPASSPPLGLSSLESPSPWEQTLLLASTPCIYFTLPMFLALALWTVCVSHPSRILWRSSGSTSNGRFEQVYLLKDGCH